MRENETRHRELETLLARGLRQMTASEPCPEPEILAAFVERNLSKPEAHRLEHHLAACGRCQAQMAAMVRSLEASERTRPTVDVVKAAVRWMSAERRVWTGSAPPELVERRRRAWRWLAPVAAAALVVVAVWVVDPELVRQSREPRSPLTPTLSPVPPPESPGREAVAPEESRAAAPPLTPTLSPASGGEGGRRPGEGEPDLPSRADSQPREKVEQAAPQPGAEAAVGRPEPNRATEAAASPSAALAGRRSGIVGGVAGGVAGGVRSDQIGLDLTIRTPNPSVLWRIRRPAIIERSTDGGALWEVQVTEAASKLLAGSAVSDVVCWVVGRGGVVMRTADGMRWERVAAPTATDLVAVVASDATSTIVTTATGERYQTNDGGRTWIRLP